MQLVIRMLFSFSRLSAKITSCPLWLSGLLFFCFLAHYTAFAQVAVSGRVLDANSGDGMPFVNVFVKGTTIGITTDFEGRFQLKNLPLGDSLTAAYIGYLPKKKLITAALGQSPVIFRLETQDLQVAEATIRPGENPAYPILREVIRNKNRNDKKALDSYAYECYNKVELDVDNLSKTLEKRRAIKKIKSVMDSIQLIAGEDGKPILPVFMSEAISDVYTRRDPVKKKEIVKHTKITGISMDDGSMVSQLIGSSLQEYNFYNNWLNVLDKYFVSPIADGWRIYYDYDLVDSLMVNGDYCYRIDYFPRRPQDLAFKGSIWITKAEFALKQIDATVGKEANVNFIEKIKIQQELQKTTAGPWLPSKNRVLIDISQIQSNLAGMLAKFYTSNRNIVVNDPKPLKFFDVDVEVANNALKNDESFWDASRHDTLTATEKNVFRMIDTVRNLPIVKTYVEIANVAVNGYKRVGKIDVGPYLYTYAFNNVEGHRPRVGLKTNIEFSKHFVLRGYLAYGTKDQRIKHELGLDYILNRKHWTVFGFTNHDDLEQLALQDNSLAANSLFAAFTRFGRLTNSRPFYQQSNEIYASSEFRNGYTVDVSLANKFNNFSTGEFAFKYFPPGQDSKPQSNFTVTEAKIQLKIAPDETFILNENSRISLGAYKWPIFTFRFTRGIQGFLDGDFNYEKYGVNVLQYINMGLFGKARLTADAGLIPSVVPYPLLRAHLGNQTPFFNGSSFNTMRYFEFVSDRYAQLNYQHYFEGLGLNSLPLIKKWNLRLLASGNILFGSVSNKNIAFSRSQDSTANEKLPFLELDRGPFAEVGYGIENIFRFVRVDFIHRLTYLDNPGARPFVVKVSAQFKL